MAQARPWSTHQSSGYDRGGGFYDSGNFIRIEEGNRYVLLDTTGPGVIDRMWFTHKLPGDQEPYDLFIYLDHETEPTLHLRLESLFDGSHPPFLPPLADHIGDPLRPGLYSYVPIGFQSAAKIVLQPASTDAPYEFRTNSAGEKIPHVYYQITYRKLPDGAVVQPFSRALSPPEQEAFDQIAQRWSNPALTAPAPPRAGRQVEFDDVVEPGQSIPFFSSAQPGTITELRIRTEHPANLKLEFVWDGASSPAVASPLGPFFACPEFGAPESDVTGYWVGYAKGFYYCRLRMPFHQSADLRIISRATQPVRVTGSVTVTEVAPEGEAAPLHAKRYDYASLPKGEDYLVLDTQGSGQFIGLVMDRPGHMEGDDRFFVDGEATPSIHGTGTEDFFNFAWGLVYLGTYAQHGMTQSDGKSCAYRFHLPAGVPYQESLRIDWEHGHHPDRGVNFAEGRYSGVVFFYQTSK